MNRCIGVNEKIHEMLNFKEIENRIKKRTGLSEGKDIAALFKMTPQNYSNKKGLGTILPTIIEWAIQENVNLDWLIKGSIKAYSPLMVSEEQLSEYNPPIRFEADQQRHKLLQSKLQRILDEGDKVKIEAVKGMLKAFDPGEKKQDVDCAENEGAGAARDRAA